MKKLLKPAIFLLAFLALICFFLIGLVIAKLTAAAEGQGLAGGAIVLFYGLVSALIGLIAAIALGYFLPLKRIKQLNLVVFILALVVFAYLWLSRDVDNTEHVVRLILEFRPVDLLA